MSNLLKILEDCRAELAAGASVEAVEKLSRALSGVVTDRRVQNEVILHLSQLRSLADRERKGLLTAAEAEAQRNRVTNSVLEFLDEIPRRIRLTAADTAEPGRSPTVETRASDTGARPSAETFDVFLSHNSVDKPVVRRIADELKKRGVKAWIDESDLAIGRPWIPELESAMNRSRAVAVFVGPSGLGRWQTPEMWVFLRRSFERGQALVPVLLPGVADRPELPEFLALFTWVDLSAGIADAALDRLADALRTTPRPS